MKCPFRVKTFNHREFISGKAIGNPIEVHHCYFEDCHGDECPFYYTDEDNIEKCARCDGGPREEEL